MKFSAAAVVAAAAGVSAGAYGGNVTYTTEVVDVYTTYCPFATEITHGAKTYTVTEATTLTISDCPCTITKPVITTSAVVCHNCPAPGYTNSTLIPVVPTVPTTVPGVAATGTASVPVPVSTGEAPTEVPTAGAAKVAAAGLAGIVGIAAFIL